MLQNLPTSVPTKPQEFAVTVTSGDEGGEREKWLDEKQL